MWVVGYDLRGSVVLMLILAGFLVVGLCSRFLGCVSFVLFFFFWVIKLCLSLYVFVGRCFVF